MALFERPSQHDVFSLLRVGFAARLRWELSDTFVSLNSSAELKRTDSRSSSTVFFFVSDDSLPASHTRNAASKLTETPWPSRTMLAAVLARPGSSSDTSFLTLSGNTPHLSDAPGLVKISVPRGADNPHRALIALQKPGPGGAFLSLTGGSGSAALKSSVSKRELFHLEILPGTLGKGFVMGPFDHAAPALTAVQALSQMLLELGVRFRLRSVHSRVLRKDDGDGEIIAVVQNGPKTSLEETHRKEVILTAFKLDGTVSGPEAYARARFAFKDVDGGKVLSVAKGNLEVSRAKTLCETAAVLVPEGRSVKFLCVQSRNGWGVINVGNIGGQSDEAKGGSGSGEWLMAGPKGRLEVRSNPSGWESFTIEFVRQSFDVALRELPRSPVYKVASEATHAAVRAEIASKVAKVQGNTSLNPEAPKKKGGFNHFAALAGLSESPEVASKSADVKPANANKSGQKATTSSKPQQKRAGRTATAVAASAASTLPRNQASRKAAKRNKKKQKAKNAKRTAAAGNEANVQISQGAPTAMTGGKSAQASEGTDKANDGEKPTVSKTENSPSSSSTEKVASKSGPPCAACGRTVEGTYTTALGKNFHPHCFCCGKCRRPMGAGAGQFRERGGVPYCQSCYATHLASRCARCSQPIMDTVITAMEKTWHKDCLTCTICRLPLTQTFWLYADKPNEPRCSRCVTGNEEYVGHGHGSGRMVNLPTFGRTNTPSVPAIGPTTGSSTTGPSGRARLMAPVLPRTTRR